LTYFYHKGHEEHEEIQTKLCRQLDDYESSPRS